MSLKNCHQGPVKLKKTNKEVDRSVDIVFIMSGATLGPVIVTQRRGRMTRLELKGKNTIFAASASVSEKERNSHCPPPPCHSYQFSKRLKAGGPGRVGGASTSAGFSHKVRTPDREGWGQINLG